MQRIGLTPRSPSILAVARNAYRGDLPERYRDYPASFRAPFERILAAALAGGGTDILDVGSGRTPTVPPERRPAGCRYVGLDISRGELERAPAGSYDEVVAGDIVTFDPALEERFDLIVSFQALEHVEGLDRALENIRRYLRPGGRLVAQLSGTFSAYGLISRVTPRPVTHWVQRRLYGRDPDTVFRSHYDRCWHAALERMTEAWAEREIAPLWIAEPYFHFSRVLRSAYLAYEEWARRGGRNNLAPYYLVTARR